MKVYAPSYYKDFNCIGSSCKDNCCIGWGIYIDDKSREYYQGIKGEFGDFLNSSIVNGEFLTHANGRCKMLDNNNLCSIYSNLGENALCQICTDHPRFYNWIGDRREEGLGLSCPTAYELIVNSDFTIDYMGESDETTQDVDSEFLKEILNHRLEIMNLIDNNNLFDSMIELLKQAEIEPNQAPVNHKEILFPYEDMEAVNSLWSAKISNLVESFEIATDNLQLTEKENELNYKRILKYFIYRYLVKSVIDGDINSKLYFSVSVTVLIILLDALSLNTSENSTIVSKQVEYSEENIELLMEETLFGGGALLSYLLETVNNNK